MILEYEFDLTPKIRTTVVNLPPLRLLHTKYTCLVIRFVMRDAKLHCYLLNPSQKFKHFTNITYLCTATLHVYSCCCIRLTCRYFYHHQIEHY